MLSSWAAGTLYALATIFFFGKNVVPVHHSISPIRCDSDVRCSRGWVKQLFPPRRNITLIPSGHSAVNRVPATWTQVMHLTHSLFSCVPNSGMHTTFHPCENALPTLCAPTLQPQIPQPLHAHLTHRRTHAFTHKTYPTVLRWVGKPKGSSSPAPAAPAGSIWPQPLDLDSPHATNARKRRYKVQRDTSVYLPPKMDTYSTVPWRRTTDHSP